MNCKPIVTGLLFLTLATPSVWAQAKDKKKAPQRRLAQEDVGFDEPEMLPPPPSAPTPTPPAGSPGATGKTKDGKPVQGFVSKKTGKSLAEAGVEDITNENFPDMIESFDYPNADVADLVKAISELTGKNFVVDPQVRGKITIIAPSRLTVAEAYKAFLSALAINGLAIVPGDGFYKIKQARAAQRDNIDTFSGAYYPNSDQMITRIIKLKYISADEVNKQLRILTSKDGELVPYTPTNSLIVSDYGANMDRIMKILEQLDVQGFEEQMEVIRVRFARSKDIGDLVDQIINKGEKKNQFGTGVPRFRPAGGPESGGGTGAEVYSLVVPDERTNSIIVVGNKMGIEKIRKLVSRLDYPMRPDEQGGFFVYSLRHAEAEPIANILNGIASESKKAQDSGGAAGGNRPPVIGPGGQAQVGPAATAIFGGDVKISADKTTNSLIIVASRPDYETLKNLLGKIDIARDQVFIKAIIMEMNAGKTDSWSVDAYKFAANTNGVGRFGFRGSQEVSSLINPSGDRGAILGFGNGGITDIKIGAETFKVPSLIALVRLLTTHANGHILSTPQIMALDNEEALIEVGAKVPVALNASTATAGVVTSNVERQNVTTKLTLTPYISPDTDEVQMKVDQEVADISTTQQSSAGELAKNAISTDTRKIKTQIIVNSGDTAVLGGLMKDVDKEDVTKVPILGDIPILGWLFKAQTKQKIKSNLVVFITPKIVRNPGDGAKLVDDKINERIDFIQKNMSGRDPHGSAIDNLPRLGSAKSKKEKDSAAPAPEEPAVESF